MKKGIALILCFVSFIYTVWYMHFGVAYKNSGALSKIGLSHRGYFIIWGALTFTALAYGIIIAFRRYTKTRIYVPLLVISAVGMMLTLAFDFDFDKKVHYYLHCSGSLTFSAVMGITVLLLFLLCFNQSAVFRLFAFITSAILISDLICLLIFKETALIEVLPVFAGYIMLCIINLRRDRVEIKQ